MPGLLVIFITCNVQTACVKFVLKGKGEEIQGQFSH